MKTHLLWACVCVCGATLASALPPPQLPAAAAAAPLAPIAQLALPASAPLTAAEAAAAAAEEAARVKRSGSGGLLGIVANKVTSKLGSLAQASAGLSSHDHGHHEVEYPPVTSYGHKSFDLWSFKKALLSTLLQAVKAVKGGLIALKGQLIKAKGHILTTKGALFKAKGEALTDFGRHIATKALLPALTSSSSSGHSAPSAHAHGHVEFSGPAYLPPSYYGPPPLSAPSLHYGPPGYQQFHHRARSASASAGDAPAGKLPDDVHAGLLILKPLPGHGASSGSAGAAAAAGAAGAGIAGASRGIKSFLGLHSVPVASAVKAPVSASQAAAAATAHLPAYAAIAASEPQVTVQKALDFDAPHDFGQYFHSY